jgi:hypothetical protein
LGSFKVYPRWTDLKQDLEGMQMPTLKDSPRVDSTGRAYAGSQKQIQLYVNEGGRALSSGIAQSLSQYGLDEKDVQWVSPLEVDSYQEYRDVEFLECLGLGSLGPQLCEFWPQRGPCWDALARIDGGCILIEAKSHVSEIYSGGCKASPESMQKIQSALDSAKKWLNVPQDVDWKGRLYQSANRYATLYFLREIAGVRAFLTNVYFLDDPIKRTTRKEWDDEIAEINRELGIKGKVPYTATCFLNAR